jgi:NitT/TauT family transport system substrate-binding protein
LQRDPQGIMVRSHSPVKSFVDLDGHTVAVKSGSTWFEYLVKRNQLNRVREIPATYSVTNFVADPQYIQQAFATSEPFFLIAPVSRRGCYSPVTRVTARTG